MAYNFAAFLVRDLNLHEDEALKWLSSWDSANTPPKGEERLREIIGSAHKYGKKTYGSGLVRPRPGGSWHRRGRRAGNKSITFEVKI